MADQTPPPTTTTTGPDYAGGPPGRPTNPLAIASIVVSLVALVGCCLGEFGLLTIPLAIVGAVLGGVAEKQIREGKGDGMKLAKAGRIIGIVVSVILTIIGLLALAGVAFLASEGGQEMLREQGLEMDEEGNVREVEPDLDDGEPLDDATIEPDIVEDETFE